MKAGIKYSISGAIALVLVLAGYGCSQDRSLSGMWKGDRDWKKVIADEAAARATSAVNLNLKSDGTFVLQDGGPDFTGTWVQSGSKVELQVEKFLNRPIEQQSEDTKRLARFDIRIENNRMYFKNAVYDVEIELKKQAKPH